jgi:hypothetical protein
MQRGNAILELAGAGTTDGHGLATWAWGGARRKLLHRTGPTGASVKGLDVGGAELGGARR